MPAWCIQTALTRTAGIHNDHLLHPIRLIHDKVRLTVRTKNLKKLGMTCQEWSVRCCAMCSYNRIEPVLRDDLFLPPDRTQVYWFMHALGRACLSADAVAAAFNPIPTCRIAILFKSMNVFWWLNPHNMHCNETARIQELSIYEYILHDVVRQDSLSKKERQMLRTHEIRP